VSRSPFESEQDPSVASLAIPEDPRTRDYAEGWIAINELMRSGWSWSGNEAHNVFLNLGLDEDGRPRFVDASSTLGFDALDDGRAAVRMDVDRDGDLDLLVSNRNGPRLKLYRNDLDARGRFVALRLVGDARNPTGVGAHIELRVAADGRERRLVRGVRAGEGFLSQQPGWVHVGLGPDAGGEEETLDVSVRGPDGETEEFGAVQRDGWFLLERGAGAARAWEREAAVSGLRLGGVEPPAVEARARIVLPQALPLPGLDLRERDGEVRRVFGIREGGRPVGTGRPLFLSVWASWCAPCVEELVELRKAADRLGDLGILALSVDEDEDVPQAVRLLERIGWPFPAAYATEETRSVLDVLVGALFDTERPLAVPLGLLVNARGELVSVYVGRVEPARLLADLRLLDADPASRAHAATPFSGIWYRAPEAPDPAALEARLRARGLERQANEYGRAQLEVAEGRDSSVLRKLARRAAERGELDRAVRILQQAARQDPGAFEVQADLGVALHRAGRYAEAVDAYSAALLVRDDAGVRAKRGLSYLLLERLELAARELEVLREQGAREAEALADAIERLERGGG